MITNNFPLTQTDPELKRRQALAKVYRLLIRLAEEAKSQSTSPESANEEETVEESNKKV